jgi:hypothetical protein
MPRSDATGATGCGNRQSLARDVQRVPDLSGEVPLVDKTFVGLLNEWVAMPEHQICLYDA